MEQKEQESNDSMSCYLNTMLRRCIYTLYSSHISDKETSKVNMIKRLNQITNIVEEQVSMFMDFKLTQKITKQMFVDVKNAILSWKGVDLTFCAKQKTTFHEYNKTSMNWFNRNKAKLYGNYFFYPLIFIHILNFCNDLNVFNMDNNKRNDLYLSILIKILEAKIKFPRTKEQPLLPNQTLMQPNKFKTIFIKFLNHFDIEFHSNKNHKNDKQRSNKISKKVVSSLYKIKHKMMNENECKLFRSDEENMSEDDKLSVSGSSFSDVSSDHDDANKIKLKQHVVPPLYSVLVPINSNNAIQYEFLSFNPLFIKQNMLSSITQK